ncbi:MAG: MoxR family ATPase [Nanopusillaceae archaeon]
MVFVEQIKIDKIPEILDLHFLTGKAVLLLGPPGIGKSEIVRQFAIKKAEKINRVFVDWHDISGTEKEEEILKNPEKYFLFVDIKLYEYDPTDIKGFIYIDEKNEKTVILPWSWIKFFTKENAAGIIFLDELNMASPDTVKIAFQLVYQRVISNRRISKNVLIVSAGNPTEYNFLASDLPQPLIDRMGIYYVYTNFNSWIKWASNNNIHPLIIKFLSLYPQYLYYDKRIENQNLLRICTPRSWAMLSDLIYAVEKKFENEDTNIKYNYIKAVASGYLHPEVYSKFAGFLNALNNLDMQKITKNIVENPENLLAIRNNIEQVILFVSYVSSQYANGNINEEKFRDILKTLYAVYTEAATLLIIETINKIKTLYKMEEAKQKIQKLVDLLNRDFPDLYDILIKLLVG